MSLPMMAIDRLFQRLAATYTSAWAREVAAVPLADLKTAWGHELAVFSGNLEAVAWALDNLPPRCPNAIEFKLLCRSAPAKASTALSEPAVKADPARVAAELAKLIDLRGSTVAHSTYDHKAWAKRLIAQHDTGRKLNPTTLLFARQALGIKAPTKEAA